MTKKLSRVPATVFNAFALMALAPYVAVALFGGLGSECWGWVAMAFAALVYPVVNLLALWLPGTARRPSWQMTKKVCRIVAIGLNVVVLLFLAVQIAARLGRREYWEFPVMEFALAVYPAVNLLALLLPDMPQRPLDTGAGQNA